jgi:hypothetical protein
LSGVDDAFLIFDAWLHPTAEETLAGSSRLAVALAEAGPSMSITSLTNALAFGIGSIIPLPYIRLFSCKIYFFKLGF